MENGSNFKVRDVYYSTRLNALPLTSDLSQAFPFYNLFPPLWSTLVLILFAFACLALIYARVLSVSCRTGDGGDVVAIALRGRSQREGCVREKG